jgi:protein SCO1/2
MRQNPLFSTLLLLLLFSGMIADRAMACEEHAQAKKVESTSALPGSSIYHLDSTWTDQNEIQHSLAQLAGKPRLIAMVFTRCETACPLLVQDMKSLKSAIPVELFSFDSDRETAASLKKFILKYKLDEKRWTAHTSSSSAVAELAAALGIQYKKLDSGDFIHANIIFLLNENGEVVAKQEGLNSSNADFAAAVKKYEIKP